VKIKLLIPFLLLNFVILNANTIGIIIDIESSSYLIRDNKKINIDRVHNLQQVDTITTTTKPIDIFFNNTTIIKLEENSAIKVDYYTNKNIEISMLYGIVHYQKAANTNLTIKHKQLIIEPNDQKVSISLDDKNIKIGSKLGSSKIRVKNFSSYINLEPNSSLEFKTNINRFNFTSFTKYQFVLNDDLFNKEEYRYFIRPALSKIASDQEFYISRYEITNSEFILFLNDQVKIKKRWFESRALDKHSNIIKSRGVYKVIRGFEQHPINEVSWFGAVAYTQWLSKKTLDNYSLPTVKEFELAVTDNYSKKNIQKYAWTRDNAKYSTHKIGEKKSNDLMIYDLFGNVWEWTLDATINNTKRVIKGGSWLDYSSKINRELSRNETPYKTSGNIGFRVVKHIKAIEEQPIKLKSFHKNGNLKYILPLQKRVLDGTLKIYYPNKTTNYKIVYVNGEIQSSSRYFKKIILTKPITKKTYIIPSMSLIAKGRFLMGDISGDEGSDERPVHQVKINYDFYISINEVTFNEYEKFVKDVGLDLPNDNRWGRGNRPVINVSWEDANRYTLWLSKKSGKKIRLPSEAEWEYAARAGTKTKYSFGNSAKNIDDFSWNYNNSENKTHIVGQKLPNNYGLFDIEGNVAEWVQDWYTPSYRYTPRDGYACIEEDIEKVYRGGSYSSNESLIYISNRNAKIPVVKSSKVGFRIVMEVNH